MFLVIVSGNPLDRIEGPITLVEMAVAAISTLSASTRILGRLGTIVDKMPTTSSALSAGLRATELCCSVDFVLLGCELEVSVNEVGLVVNRAVRSRRNRSY